MRLPGKGAGTRGAARKKPTQAGMPVLQRRSSVGGAGCECLVGLFVGSVLLFFVGFVVLVAVVVGQEGGLVALFEVDECVDVFF